MSAENIFHSELTCSMCRNFEEIPRTVYGLCGQLASIASEALSQDGMPVAAAMIEVRRRGDASICDPIYFDMSPQGESELADRREEAADMRANG